MVIYILDNGHICSSPSERIDSYSKHVLDLRQSLMWWGIMVKALVMFESDVCLVWV